MAVSSLHTARKSLLDAFQQGQSLEQEKAPKISRFIYVARMSGEAADGAAVESTHQASLDTVCGAGAYTGLLVLFPKCLVHVLEVESKKVMPTLHALHLAGGVAQLQDIKLFSQWHIGHIKHDCKDQHEGLDSSLLVQTVSALNIGCEQIAKEVQSSSSQQITQLSSWAVPETILALTYTEAVPSLKEYLELFDGAISATLDSERVWP